MSNLSRTAPTSTSTPHQSAGRKWLVSNTVLLVLVVIVALLLIADLTLLKPGANAAAPSDQASQPALSQSASPLSDGY